MASSLLVPVSLLANQMSLIDLEALQAHIASLISGFPPASAAAAVADEEKLLTQNQLHQEVIKMAATKDKAFKAGWRKVVANRGMVENVFGILEECYPNLRTKSSNPEGWKAARELGGRQTLKWQSFKLRVIEHLYKKGSFGSPDEEGGFQDFEDTAGGCDEVAWDAACYLLEQTPVV
jgi:hypothetical protein